MFKSQMLILATASMVALGAGCSRYGSAGGEIGSVSPAEAAKTVTLVAYNDASTTVELRVISHGDSRYVGSVSSHDTTTVLLDPSILPAADLYVIGVPADGRGRAVGGPLAVTRGSKINFTIDSNMALSQAIVKTP